MKARSPRSPSLAGVLAALVFCGVAGRVAAEAMSDAELDEVRGGYFTAAGITFGFGATVTTLVDGEMALQSSLTLTDGGAVLSERAGQATTVQPLTPAVAQATGLGGLPGQGLVAMDPSGVSAIVHSLTGDQILNLVVNTASGRTITQQTAVTLTLPNFPSLQHGLSTQLTSANLLSAMSVGAIAAVRH